MQASSLSTDNKNKFSKCLFNVRQNWLLYASAQAKTCRCWMRVLWAHCDTLHRRQCRMCSNFEVLSGALVNKLGTRSKTYYTLLYFWGARNNLLPAIDAVMCVWFLGSGMQRLRRKWRPVPYTKNRVIRDSAGKDVLFCERRGRIARALNSWYETSQWRSAELCSIISKYAPHRETRKLMRETKAWKLALQEVVKLEAAVSSKQLLVTWKQWYKDVFVLGRNRLWPRLSTYIYN